jgi:hypothetical protein
MLRDYLFDGSSIIVKQPLAAALPVSEPPSQMAALTVLHNGKLERRSYITAIAFRGPLRHP